MSKHETFFPKSSTDFEVSVTELGHHLGVSRNSASAIAVRFGLTKLAKGYRKLDVFRQIHGIEPLLLPARLAELKAANRGPDSAADAEPGQPSLIPEVLGISDLTETLWDQGLVHRTDFAGEYGFTRGTFCKKLKFGGISLPPVAAIQLSSNREMYRPLEVILWRRHCVALTLPRAALQPQRGPLTPPQMKQANSPPAKLNAEALDQAVFELAIAGVDEKSGFKT
tara:strand:+ start:711 stop:1385 length:675 start_codon:yes stop_codon:yes gene_type:complete